MNEQVRPKRSDQSAFGIKLTDAEPLSGIPAVWRLGAIVSTLLMGFIALIAALYFGRPILLPVTAALIVGITLSPATELGVKYGIPTPVSVIAVVVLLVAVFAALITFFATPLTEWIARAPEIGAAVQEKVRVFDYPLSVLRELKNAIVPAAGHGPTVAVDRNPAEIVGAVLLAVTPAVGQFVVFFGTLIFFLITNIKLRHKLIVAFGSRDARLRMIRIWNDIEDNLVGYVALMTMINLALGAVTAG